MIRQVPEESIDEAITIREGSTFHYGLKKEQDAVNAVDEEIGCLNKSFSDLLVLKQICLKVKKGDLVCVIGDVGSGKTSLLNCITNDMLYMKNSSMESSAPIVTSQKLGLVQQSPWI